MRVHACAAPAAGLRLGADHYHATGDPETFQRLAGSFDLILNTVSASIDVDAYLGLLAVDGTLVNVGAPASADQVNEPYERVLASDVRYRFVIDATTLG